jgi:uncharacterized protein (TIGR02145 family)
MRSSSIFRSLLNSIRPVSNISYGLLYNWYAANSSNGIAPIGWKVPLLADWTTLWNYLGGISIAGGKCKEVGYIHWNYPNTGATNSSKLTIFGGGWRYSIYNVSPYFDGLKNSGYFHNNLTYVQQIRYDSIHEYAYTVVGGSPANDDKKWGMSIRCLLIDTSQWYPGMVVRDYDGNIYTTVKIGTQVWLQQNLAVTHFSNGVPIPEVQNANSWFELITPGCCAYDNNWDYVFLPGYSNVINYGLLYNWYAANNALTPPIGWHIPSTSEYQTLFNNWSTLIEVNKACRETGIIHWISDDEGATNSSGFTAVGNGIRNGLLVANFQQLKNVGELWTNTEDSLSYGVNAYANKFVATGEAILARSIIKKQGCAIRLIRDNLTGYTEGEKVSDYDGNIYDTVLIGGQVWMVQNYACKHLRSGVLIPEVIDGTAWLGLSTQAICAYDNDWTNVFHT